MFVKRNPGRKGPSNRQVYVPHDQRELNPTPIPIRTLKEADFYISQLRGMGLMPTITETPYIDIFSISRTSGSKIRFDIGVDQQLNLPEGLSPDVLSFFDVHGNPLDKNSNDLVNKVTKNGYYLGVIAINNGIAWYNGTNEAHNVVSLRITDENAYLVVTDAVNAQSWLNTWYGTAVPVRFADRLCLMDSDKNPDEYDNFASFARSDYFYIEASNIMCYVIKQ